MSEDHTPYPPAPSSRRSRRRVALGGVALPVAALLAAACFVPGPSPSLAYADDHTPAASTEATEPSGKTEKAEHPEKAQKAEPADPRDERIEELQKQSQLLTAEQSLRSAKVQKGLAELQEEKQRLQAEYDLLQQRQRSELVKWELEKQRIEADRALEQARRDIAEAEVQAKIADMERATKLEKAKHQAELDAMQREVALLNAQKQLEDAKRAREFAAWEAEQAEINAKNALINAQLQAKETEAKAASQAMQLEMQAIEHKMQAREKRDKLSRVVLDSVKYRTEPFDNGTLYISDRRIKLNGPIITGTADYITERIHYYNNENNELPIFIVIDNCPGGSVQQGYRILKAMEASDAPIHVVVKSFAASMAACITTLAEHSYAYPNAVILHHQMSAGVGGNMTDIKDMVETLKKWEERLMQPLAEKQGITIEEFRNRMYEAKASGDWDEFATEAVKMKWVNHIVHQIREDSLRDEPNGDPPMPWYYSLLMEDASTGRAFFQLPPLEPFDAYFMYNPNGYYRMTPTGYAR